MGIINRILTTMGDAVYAVLGGVHVAFALVVISGVFGVVALLVIRYCSNQTAVGRIKDEIKAHLLAIKLFKDELGVMFRALPRILWATARLQAHMIPPLVVMLIPMLLVCSQMAGHHEWRPLRPGERAVLTLALAGDSAVAETAVSAQPPAGVSLDHQVRCVGSNEISWYVQGAKLGHYDLAFRIGNERVTKTLVVDDGPGRVSPKRHSGDFVSSFFYPRERPFEAGSTVQAITIQYPPLDSWIYGSVWWAVWFLALSIAIALVFKPWLKVKF